jgi:transmembrane sensor
MSDIRKLRTRAEVDEEAAVWAWRMDADSVSAADRQSFESWLRSDPRNRRASEELTRVLHALDELAEVEGGERIATYAGGVPHTEGSAGANGVGHPLPPQSALAPRHTLRWAAAAAVILASLLIVWAGRDGESRTLATAVGRQKNVTLADGSVVTLNTNTIVETNLRLRTRDIYLRQGEAHFQVAHDGSRPFLVHAGDAVVRAVGTQFDVRLRDARHVDVLVTEGRVEFQETATPPGPPSEGTNPHVRTLRRDLQAGEKISTAGDGAAVTPVSALQVSTDMAWREGAIIFQGTSLADAVAEIERYTDSRIIIDDPRIATLSVGGRFKTGDVQGFFDALQSALPVSIRRTAGGLVYVDPAAVRAASPAR